MFAVILQDDRDREMVRSWNQAADSRLRRLVAPVTAPIAKTDQRTRQAVSGPCSRMTATGSPSAKVFVYLFILLWCKVEAWPPGPARTLRMRRNPIARSADRER